MNDVPWLKDQVSFLMKKGVGITIFKLPNGSIISRIKSIISLRLLIRTKRYDFIHCHWGFNTIFAYNHKIPIITTYHGSDLQGVIDKSGKLIIKAYVLIFFSRLSTYISKANIFVSERLLRSVPRKIINETNIILPMGYNEKKFRPLNKIESKNKLGLSKKKKYVLFAGNYSQNVKGYLLADEVMKILDESFEIIKLDYAPHDDIIDYMNSSEVLLMTSYSEGAPVIVKEALACGLPVVSTDVGDVKNLIKLYPNCFVVKTRDPQEIASLVIKSTNTKIQNLSFKGITAYTGERMNNKLYKFYRRLYVNKCHR